MKKILLVLTVMIILLAGCTNNKGKVKYSKITAEKAKEIIDQNNPIILDVRTPEEYEEEHIEGALLIPDYQLESSAAEKLPDKDAKILIYCRSGNRSKTSSKTLIDMGYTDVHDFGGIISWPYETSKEK